MTKIDEIKEKILQHKDEIKLKFHVKEIGLFGSIKRNEHTSISDLDVLVEFSEPVSMFEFIDLEEYIENIVKIKVDLVSKKGLKPRIGKNILSEVEYI